MNKIWCSNCGNPGPFDKNICYSCGHAIRKYITDQKQAYKIWLDYQRIEGELRKELEKLNDV